MNRLQINNIGDRFRNLQDRYERTYVNTIELNDYINRMFMINTTYFIRAYRETNKISINIGLNAKKNLDVYLHIRYRLVGNEKIYITNMFLEYYKEGNELYITLKNHIDELIIDRLESGLEYDSKGVEITMNEDEINTFLYGGLCYEYLDYSVMKWFNDYIVTINY